MSDSLLDYSNAIAGIESNEIPDEEQESVVVIIDEPVDEQVYYDEVEDEYDPFLEMSNRFAQMSQEGVTQE